MRRSPPPPLLPKKLFTSMICGWGENFTFQVGSTSASVPAPATLALMGVGLLALGGLRRKRKRLGTATVSAPN